jgi:hypothetical protein
LEVALNGPWEEYDGGGKPFILLGLLWLLICKGGGGLEVELLVGFIGSALVVVVAVVGVVVVVVAVVVVVVVVVGAFEVEV